MHEREPLYFSVEYNWLFSTHRMQLPNTLVLTFTPNSPIFELIFKRIPIERCLLFDNLIFFNFRKSITNN